LDGLAYVRRVQPYLPDAHLLDLLDNVRDRDRICSWIGTHIPQVNAELERCLLACHDCFYPAQRRPMQIFALPLALDSGLAGCCNLATQPITLIIDVGRVIPQHWLHLVLHEYAHAQVASPGHHAQFAATLAHLCLGLGIQSPSDRTELALRTFPPCTTTMDPLAFWRGE
jgi:hypothetical protein